MKGLVMRSTGMWYDVLLEDNRMQSCRVRGKLRLEGFKETNPIAVGDYVDVETEGSEGVITRIHERKNHILRQSVKKTQHAHVLAANIDLAVLVVTMSMPRTSSGFIDRFLVTAESFDVPQALIFNKQDLLTEEDQGLQSELIATYETLGIPCVKISAVHDKLTPVMELLSGKTSLIAGHSGVGKSTMLNKLSPSIQQSVAEISSFSQKGTHTTTFAEMFGVDDKTFVIDTPGIKEWGLIGMKPEELSDNFPEMRNLRAHCKFGYRCLHFNEPKCAVKEAVENGAVALSRYENYLSMLIGEDNRK
ncbi:MAG: ribosome small subunit-dependent GTPase A [Cyclobacteriaceae bacterium]|jgi:ribosome biogenesis GTPase|nr:ribosome small subunit-dependent GTPase A [Cyclobacteriaceae bacterium]